MAYSAALEGVFGRLQLLWAMRRLSQSINLAESWNMLVAFGNAAVPWDNTCNRTEIDQIGTISWRFLPAGGIVPYEFTASQATRLPENQVYDGFAQKLGGVLREMHLEQLLGLFQLENSSVQSPAMMVFTSGRADLTVPDVMWGLDNASAAVEASWQLGPQGEVDYTFTLLPRR